MGTTRKPSWLAVSLSWVALLGAAGCGDDDAHLGSDSGTNDGGGDGDGDGDGDSGPPPMNAALKVVTFNAGLLETVGFVPERRPLVNDALAELDADVLCVQEVWQDSDWEALVDANADVRSHTERIEPMPGVEGTCSPEELNPLRACAEMMCPDAGPSDLFSCTISMCGPEVENLAGACSACLVDNAGSGDLDAITMACLGTGSGDDGPIPPEERSYLLGGAFGIGLLSKLPLNDVDTLLLDSSTTRRGVLYASIDVPELGEIAVFCTHLSAVLNDVRYEGGFGDWEGENTAQLEAMLEWVDEKTDAGAQVILLGDLNTGPEVGSKDIVAEVPESFAQLADYDYEAPFLDGPDADCTFCSANPLVVSGDTGVGGTIDHVVVRGFDTEVEVVRILDELNDVESDADAGVVPSELPYSDHYGLEATFFE